MNHEQSWVERVARQGALAPADAARALAATLGALGEHLTEDERNRVAHALPVRIGEMLGLPRAGADPATFFERVALHEGTTAGFAREHAQTVGRVLAEDLPAEVVAHLLRSLPPPLHALLERSAEAPPPEHPLAASERHHTLASGRAGSRHPLSESAPPGAQTHSVGEANPHGATKLSSAQGITQERERESMATDVPDERRTIANAKD